MSEVSLGDLLIPKGSLIVIEGSSYYENIDDIHVLNSLLLASCHHPFLFVYKLRWSVKMDSSD
jgi:hypothetical protein